MYLFISETEIQQYNGDVIKYSVGARLVKTISNPTNEQLRDFGYMELIEEETPEYDQETQYLTFVYSVVDGDIHKVYSVEEIPEEPEIPEEIEEEPEIQEIVEE